MVRAELTEKILSQKRLKQLSWKTVVAEIGGGSPVYLTAALMGQSVCGVTRATNPPASLNLFLDVDADMAVCANVFD